MAQAWRNWSGSVECAPVQIAVPEGEAALAGPPARADAPIRVAGAGHSFTPLCETDGTLVSLDRLSGIVASDRDAGTATIWAGTRLHDLGAPLLAAGQALENMGDIDKQALGGVVGTGT